MQGIPAGPRRRRDGFTLVEMLTVIAIIAILVALGSVAYFKFIGSASANNTTTTMTTVYQTFQRHWNQVISDAKKEEIPAGVVSWAGADPTRQRARVLWIKLRLAEAFPTSYDLVTNHNAKFFGYASGYIPAGRRKYLASYKSALGGKTAASDPQTESAACLLLALSVSRDGIQLNADSLGAAVKDTDGDGIKEVVDGWGKAVQFFPFPTSTAASSDLQNSNPSPSGKGNNDALDPYGILRSWSGAGRTQFETYVHRIEFPSSGSGVSCYTVPVLVSAGEDGQFGLNADMTVSAAGPAQDNLYSYKMRLGTSGK